MREHVSLVKGIFDLGIELDDEEFDLVYILVGKPSMLELYLSRRHECLSHPSRRLHSHALMTAVITYPESTKALYILLASRMVDMSFADRAHSPPRLYRTPLGYAIVGCWDRLGRSVEHLDKQLIEELLDVGFDTNIITSNNVLSNH
ncbi:uncharacterized protein F4807DRAFT_322935 [Annulohypoxylon truncatum]|uniref:uncharacterized protein n=1 Tax=Annulohypoxylon truncatum TaxID=327061 RepID=UPI002007B6DA|nr:uncharacterized protein F4807DRAFT_322935 [Annulohypoxylon truncatum]KAI1204638.1 hypothetical protein F4807DRAFT_322935 [Annulohypoxylon truncatum]